MLRRALIFADSFREFGPAIQHTGTIVGGVRGGQHLFADKSVQQRAALILGVVVNAVGVGHEAQTVGHRSQLWPERVGRSTDVPTD